MKKPQLKQPSKLRAKSQGTATASEVVTELTTSGTNGESSKVKPPLQVVTQGVEDPNKLVKYGTRILRGQIVHLESLVGEHKTRFPTAAALKKEEIVRFALDRLFAESDPVALISERRR